MDKLNSGLDLQVKRISLVDAVVDKMLNMVVSGQFNVGDRIPSEKILAQEFGVSRSTLREAFKKLENLGVVSIRQGSGTYLLQDSVNVPFFNYDKGNSGDAPSQAAKDVHSALDKHLKVGEIKLSHYLEARENLEQASFVAALKNAEPEDIRLLERVIARQKDLDLYPDRFPEIDFEFHRLMICASHNELYKHFWQILTPFMEVQIQRVYQLPGMVANACAYHMQIFNALVKKDKKQGEKAINEHIGTVTGRMLTIASQQFFEEELISE